MGPHGRRGLEGPSLLDLFFATILLVSWDILSEKATAQTTRRGLMEVAETEENTASGFNPGQHIFKGESFYSSEAMENIFPEHMFRNSNVAVITETHSANVPMLVPIMLHFASSLGPKWPVVLLTLQENWKMPESMQFRQLVEAKRIIILYLPPGTAFPDHKSVTYFMVRPWLWELFAPANRILMFQVDSILCSQSTSKVDDFLEWDFIGAPIAKRYGKGYNGGLSIRNPRLFLDIIREQQKNPVRLNVEDQWFFERLQARNARLPTEDQAKHFAVETVFYETPLGYHQPKRFLPQRMDEIRAWCPEVDMIGGGQHFF
ncbi:hypothetical protein CKAH01_11388 [Colletotrichum kahawae]|uniref:DUF5672 domain-containing protein n=1 Tax=Colletotrichum kahawae TaxID=34407 RepID=A0AAD9YV57_COLKA|nr:hypothetical protein CKAH01_11388 [Colletotrichum kahawae]